MPAQPVKRDRFEVGFQIFYKWLSLKQKGISLSAYFVDNGISNIAIYGMSSLGICLFHELKETPVQVLYGIDKMAGSKDFNDIIIYDLKVESFPKTDVIVATPAQAYWEISDDLKVITDIPILSLEDVVQYCYERNNLGVYP